MATDKYRYIDPQGALWSIEIFDVPQMPWNKKAIANSYLYSNAADSPYATVSGDDFKDVVININKYQSENAKDKLRLSKENRYITEYTWGKQEEFIRDSNGDNWNVYKIDFINDGPLGYYAGKPLASGSNKFDIQSNSEKKYPYYGISIGPAKNLTELNKDVKNFVNRINDSRAGILDPVSYDIDPEDYKEYAEEERKKDKSSLLTKVLVVGAIATAIVFVFKGASR